jgi:plastocyanin
MACGGSGGGAYDTNPTQPSNPSNPSTPTTPATPNTVTVSDNAFNPTAVTVGVGTTVTWKWSGCSGGYNDPYGYGGSTGCTTHNVTFDDGSNLASETQDTGEYKRTFSAPGTYKYHCSIHGASVMSGQIVVQ